MERTDQMLLQALRASLIKKKVNWTGEISREEWLLLFQKAEMHHILPMVYSAVYACPVARRMENSLFAPFKKRTVQMITLQTIKTRAFLNLYQYLREAGLHPVVVKGMILRELYPDPDSRASSDEDVLIRPEEFELCHSRLLEYGMVVRDPKQDVKDAHEVTYVKPGTMLYIEVHKQLFPPESEEYGDWNQFFRNMYECTIEVPIQGKLITTLEYTDHFFYLVCHALKHFLHSGFGVRQVCDMVMFANTYGERLDWEKILKNCRAIHAERFVAALLQIGKNYLNFQPEKACYPEQWRRIHVDETNLLEDLLSGGVYGGASMSRKHSSRITLHAVRAQKKGSRKQAFRNSVWHTVFPSVGALKHEYLYLRKYPFLLPVAWVSRLWKYGKENRRESDNQAAESIRIGRQRVQLMKQYGLIPENQEHARK